MDRWLLGLLHPGDDGYRGGFSLPWMNSEEHAAEATAGGLSLLSSDFRNRDWSFSRPRPMCRVLGHYQVTGQVYPGSILRKAAISLPGWVRSSFLLLRADGDVPSCLFRKGSVMSPLLS
ncbi:hypothetical protein GDO81_010952 [Engystomops pustulosus]|uniref:Uncharacterized protein n=1 Tax=Engystomops pustulosus TaxID=76066 RepID=A0AAV7C3S8_ENGPU|nr:hypothetical protein GDO81_010952 [Engystomops pustulosus]